MSRELGNDQWIASFQFRTNDFDKSVASAISGLDQLKASMSAIEKVKVNTKAVADKITTPFKAVGTAVNTVKAATQSVAGTVSSAFNAVTAPARAVSNAINGVKNTAAAAANAIGGAFEKMNKLVNPFAGRKKTAATDIVDITSFSSVFNSMKASVDSLNQKFSTSGVIWQQVIKNFTDYGMKQFNKLSSKVTGVFSLMKEGGWARAEKIANAKFSLSGLNVEWDEIYGDLDYAVSGTAYGLDDAAQAASRFVASNIKAGSEEMKTALRGIAGVAAMTNSAYSDIADIFSDIAGMGNVSDMQLDRMAMRGLNGAATLAKALNTDEVTLRKMVSKGEITFDMFSKAMFDAYGEHAANANATYSGSLSNMNAAFKKIGAEFAAPYLENVKDVFNSIRLLVNEIRPFTDQIAKIWGVVLKEAVAFITGKLDKITEVLKSADGVFAKAKAWLTEFAKKFTDGELSLKIILERVKAILGIVKPVATKVTKTVAPTVEGITKSVSTVKEHISGAVASASEGFSKVNSTFKPILTAVNNTVKPITDRVTTTIETVNTEIATARKNLKPVTDAVSKVVNESASKIKLAQAFLKPVKDTVVKTATAASKAAEPFKTALTTANTAVNSLKSSFGALAAPFKPVISALDKGNGRITAIKENVGKIVTDVSTKLEPVKPVVTTIQNAVTKTKDAFGEVATKLEPAAETVAAICETAEEISALADRVMNGEFGNGADRFNALVDAGYNYLRVQDDINKRYYGITWSLADKTDAELQSLGYTEEQIALLREQAKWAENVAETAEVIETTVALTMTELLSFGGPNTTKLFSLEGLQSVVQALRMSFEVLKSVGKDLIGIVTTLGKAIYEGISSTFVVGDITSPLQVILNTIRSIVASVKEYVEAPENNEKLVKIVKGVASWFSIISRLKFAVFNKFLRLLGWAADNVLPPILDLAARIGGVLSDINAVFQETDVFNTFFDTLGQWLNDTGIIQAAGAFGTGVFKAIGDFAEWAGDKIETFIRWLSKVKSPMDALSGIGSAISSGFSSLWSTIKNFVSGTTGGADDAWLTSLLPSVDVDTVLANLKEIPGKVIDFVTGIPSAIWDGLKSIGRGALNVGAKLIDMVFGTTVYADDGTETARGSEAAIDALLSLFPSTEEILALPGKLWDDTWKLLKQGASFAGKFLNWVFGSLGGDNTDGEPAITLLAGWIPVPTRLVEFATGIWDTVSPLLADAANFTTQLIHWLFGAPTSEDGSEVTEEGIIQKLLDKLPSYETLKGIPGTLWDGTLKLLKGTASVATNLINWAFGTDETHEGIMLLLHGAMPTAEELAGIVDTIWGGVSPLLEGAINITSRLIAWLFSVPYPFDESGREPGEIAVSMIEKYLPTAEDIGAIPGALWNGIQKVLSGAENITGLLIDWIFGTPVYADDGTSTRDGDIIARIASYIPTADEVVAAFKGVPGDIIAGLEQAKTVAGTVWDAIVEFVLGIPLKTGEGEDTTVGGLIDLIKESIPTVDDVVNAVKDIPGNIMAGLEQAKTVAGTVWDAIVEFVLGIPLKTGEGEDTTVGGLIDLIKESIPTPEDVVNAIKDFPSQVRNAFESVASSVGTVWDVIYEMLFGAPERPPKAQDDGFDEITVTPITVKGIEVKGIEVTPITVDTIEDTVAPSGPETIKQGILDTITSFFPSREEITAALDQMWSAVVEWVSEKLSTPLAFLNDLLFGVEVSADELSPEEMATIFGDSMIETAEQAMNTTTWDNAQIQTWDMVSEAASQAVEGAVTAMAENVVPDDAKEVAAAVGSTVTDIIESTTSEVATAVESSDISSDAIEDIGVGSRLFQLISKYWILTKDEIVRLLTTIRDNICAALDETGDFLQPIIDRISGWDWITLSEVLNNFMLGFGGSRILGSTAKGIDRMTKGGATLLTDFGQFATSLGEGGKNLLTDWGNAKKTQAEGIKTAFTGLSTAFTKGGEGIATAAKDTAGAVKNFLNEGENSVKNSIHDFMGNVTGAVQEELDKIEEEEANEEENSVFDRFLDFLGEIKWTILAMSAAAWVITDALNRFDVSRTADYQTALWGIGSILAEFLGYFALDGIIGSVLSKKLGVGVFGLVNAGTLLMMTGAVMIFALFLQHFKPDAFLQWTGKLGAVVAAMAELIIGFKVASAAATGLTGIAAAATAAMLFSLILATWMLLGIIDSRKGENWGEYRSAAGQVGLVLAALVGSVAALDKTSDWSTGRQKLGTAALLLALAFSLDKIMDTIGEWKSVKWGVYISAAGQVGIVLAALIGSVTGMSYLSADPTGLKSLGTAALLLAIAYSVSTIMAVIAEWDTLNFDDYKNRVIQIGGIMLELMAAVAVNRILSGRSLTATAALTSAVTIAALAYGVSKILDSLWALSGWTKEDFEGPTKLIAWVLGEMILAIAANQLGGYVWSGLGTAVMIFAIGRAVQDIFDALMIFKEFDKDDPNLKKGLDTIAWVVGELAFAVAAAALGEGGKNKLAAVDKENKKLSSKLGDLLGYAGLAGLVWVIGTTASDLLDALTMFKDLPEAQLTAGVEALKTALTGIVAAVAVAVVGEDVKSLISWKAGSNMSSIGSLLALAAFVAAIGFAVRTIMESMSMLAEMDDAKITKATDALEQAMDGLLKGLGIGAGVGIAAAVVGDGAKKILLILGVIAMFGVALVALDEGITRLPHLAENIGTVAGLIADVLSGLWDSFMAWGASKIDEFDLWLANWLDGLLGGIDLFGIGDAIHKWAEDTRARLDPEHFGDAITDDAQKLVDDATEYQNKVNAAAKILSDSEEDVAALKQEYETTLRETNDKFLISATFGDDPSLKYVVPEVPLLEQVRKRLNMTEAEFMALAKENASIFNAGDDVLLHAVRAYIVNAGPEGITSEMVGALVEAFRNADSEVLTIANEMRSGLRDSMLKGFGDALFESATDTGAINGDALAARMRAMLSSVYKRFPKHFSEYVTEIVDEATGQVQISADYSGMLGELANSMDLSLEGYLERLAGSEAGWRETLSNDLAAYCTILGGDVPVKIGDSMLSGQQYLTPKATALAKQLLDVFKTSGPMGLLTAIGDNARNAVLDKLADTNSGSAFLALHNAAANFVSGLADAIGFELDISSHSLASNFVTGFANFMNGTGSALKDIGITFANRFKEGVMSRQGLDEHSPSKEAARIARNFGAGFINGMIDIVPAVSASGTDMAKSFTSAMRRSIDQANDVLENGADPTIRPVVDMSNVESSARQMSRYFGSQTMNLDTNENSKWLTGQLANHSIDLARSAASAWDRNNTYAEQLRHAAAYDNSDVVNAINLMRGDFGTMEDAISKMPVVLDSGAVVGQLARPMDAALGRISRLKGRGN